MQPETDQDLTITEPGFYSLPADVYHGDPCVEPALSSSGAKTLITKSPFHAWAGHPKCPFYHNTFASNVADMGSAVHALVLGNGHIVRIDASDYKTKVAQAQRDMARAAGKIPLTKPQYEQAQKMAHFAGDRLRGLLGDDYIAEQAAFWKPEGMGWRRGLLDSRSKDRPIIVDFKTTAAAIDFDSCERRIFDMHYHMQAAAYEEALETLVPEWQGRVRVFFQFQEQAFPYALAPPIEMSEAAMTLGREKWRQAGLIWDACLRKGHFPSFPVHLQQACPPPWILTKWENRMLYDGSLNPQTEESE